MTECIQEAFHFAAHFSRRLEAGFTAGHVSNDGGGLLLRQVERKIKLLGRLAGCFGDGRKQELIEHTVEEMLARRICGLALGYEDLNDHEQLRCDPLMGLLSGKRKLDEPLAGKSTLTVLSWQAAPTLPQDPLLGRGYRPAAGGPLRRVAQNPAREIVLDLDATDIPLYGHQPERFSHGYYYSYCYLPLYIFAGDQLLYARLRPANQDAAAGSVDEVKRIEAQLRQHWPEVKIVLRADSGFCHEELMVWCEANAVNYVLGRARNQRLARTIGRPMHQARLLHQSTGKAARMFTEFHYQTHKSWSRDRGVVAKAEYLEKGQNPRFVVTSLSPQKWDAQDLHEKLYCARGEMENRIKEQMYLFADRLSTDEMKANQLRLYFSALAYTLVEALRRLARLKLFKIGTVVRLSVRRVRLERSSGYP